MENPLFLYVVSAGDVAIATVVIAITFTLWGGFLIYLLSRQGKS